MHQKSDMRTKSSSEELKSGVVNHRSENMLIIKILAAVAIGAAAMVLLFFIGSFIQNKEDSYFAVIYSKSGSDYFKSSKGEFELTEDTKSGTVISKDRRKLFYFTASKIGSNKLDLHCCDLTSSRKISKGGYIVDSGVGSDISINDTGKYLIYSKKNDANGEVLFYLYNTEKKNSTKIESNIKEVFILPDDDGVYFTKTQDSKIALYKYIYNKTPEIIATSVKKVTFYASKEKSALVFETNENSTVTSELYIIYGLDAKTLVSPDVTDVLYDKYVAGGNLYYFKAGKENISWKEIIADDTEIQDSQMMEPEKSDFVFIFGYSYKYRKAIEDYQLKLRRDDLRASIDRLVDGENLITAQFDCYAYNKTGTVKVGKNISPASIYSVSNSASPMLVYEKNVYQLSDITLSDIDEMMSDKDIAEVNSYVSTVLINAATSKGICLAFPGNVEGVDLNIDQLEAKGCEFGFSADGKALYVIIKEATVFESTLYKITIKNDVASQREVIDINISSFGFSGDTVWYLKIDNGSNEGSLYSYTQGNLKAVVDAVYSFICFDDSSVLIFRNHKQNQGELLADLYRCSDGSSMLIDENINLHHFRYNGSDRLTYIRNLAENAGGELCVYADKKVKVIDSGVGEIVLF